MEAVLQSSINSTIHTSQASNPSNARLLIEHIKRLVEDDMKLTVEAFRLIEEDINFDVSVKYQKKRNKTNKIPKNRTNVGIGSRQSNSHKRNSFPLTATSSLNRMARHSLSSNRSLDRNFQNDIKITHNNNFSESISYTTLRPLADDTNWTLPEFQESNSSPIANSTFKQNQYSFSSIEEETPPSPFKPSDYRGADPYPPFQQYGCENGYQSHSDDNSSRVRTVEAMYQDLKVDLHRILRRFAEHSDEKTNSIGGALRPPVETIASNTYNGETKSYSDDHPSQSSNAKPHRPITSNKKSSKQFVLPQLLAFGDNYSVNRRDSFTNGLTVISGSKNTCREQMDQFTSYSWDGKDEYFPAEVARLFPSDKCVSTDDALEITRSREGAFDGTENLPVATNQPHSSDLDDRIINTIDFNNVQVSQVAINDNNNATDVEATSSSAQGGCDDELTEAISSSLIDTPKTLKASSDNFTDLDEIALLISQASPHRRVVIKKKAPVVAAKGYKKNCNEKLIFAGEKITHVKEDRKVICRNLKPNAI